MLHSHFHPHTVQDLLSRIAQLSSRDGRKPLKVVFSGVEAYTRPGFMNLPSLPAGTLLTPNQFSIWLGYTIHEGPGHQSHTDFETYTNAVLSHNKCPIFSYVLNVLEDIRIENKDISRYPGDRKHLDSTHQYVDDQLKPEECQNPNVISLLYKEAYTKYRNLDTKRIQGQLHGKVALLLQDLPHCQSTKDCVQLAEKIVEEMKREEEEEKGEEKSRENKSEESQGRGSERGSSTEDRPTEKSSNGENSDGICPTPNDSLSSDSLSSSAQKWEQLTEIRNLMKGLVQRIQEENKDEGQRTKDKIPSSSPLHHGTTILPPVDLSFDWVFIPSDEDLPQFLQTRAKVSSQILALKKMLRIYLQTRSKKSWLRGLEDGETLDQKRLHIPATGGQGVFKSRHDREIVDTAVELMLDLSASMDETLVRTAAICLAEALSAVPRLKLSISGFTTNEKYLHHQEITSYEGLGRADGMNILLFKDYQEPYVKCKAKLGAIRTFSGTPLGDAYGKALEHTLSRPEPRRVIILVTDGVPSFTKFDQRHSDYLLMENIHEKCKRRGIETIGLGIGDEKVVKHLQSRVDKAVRIEGIEELPKKLILILKDMVK